MNNHELADVFERVADLLAADGASGFRVRAYRRAAGGIRAMPEPICELLASGGIAALEALPAIGRSIASAIAELSTTGRLGLLDKLEREVPAEKLFTTIPGIGPELAARIHRELGVETLEELEIAAHDGRLARVEGFGERRVRAVREELQAMLVSSARRVRMLRGGAGRAELTREPNVELLLDADAEYRIGAARGLLPKIAPRRFNPTGRAWLPILRVELGGFTLDLAFSNTARAHALNRTNDWVVIFWSRDGLRGRATVVTEISGPLAGRRVVRGRELECSALFTARRADEHAGALSA